MLLSLGATAGAAEGGGPTPYPDAKDQSAWPGKGPIRLFGWMVENRKSFWANREKDQGAVVFCGDSLTANWKGDAMKKAFGDLKVANRGIGGDVSRGLLFRFKEDVLDLNPKALVINIGTNDLSAHANPADIESNIKALVDAARQQSSTMPVVLCTVPPRDSKEAPAKAGAYEDINGRIKKLAEGKEHMAVLDLNKELADAEGKIVVEYFAKDKLHLAPHGYEKWAEVIKPVFESLQVK